MILGRLATWVMLLAASLSAVSIHAAAPNDSTAFSVAAFTHEESDASMAEALLSPSVPPLAVGEEAVRSGYVLANVPLYPLPPAIDEIAPAWQGLAYFLRYTSDGREAVIVDPQTRKVVARLALQ